MLRPAHSKGDHDRATEARTTEPSSPHGQKRRRVVQRTLETRFRDEQHGSPLVSLLDELRRSTFSFLDANDLTVLSASCYRLAKDIHTSRGQMPYVIRQELLPKKIVYAHSYVHDEEVDVAQSQTFRFLLRTRRHRVVEVRVRLSNDLWTDAYDHHENGEGGFSRTLIEETDDDARTEVWADVYERVWDRDGVLRHVKLFESVSDSHFHLRTMDDALESDPRLNDGDVPERLDDHVQDDLRDCVRYYLASVKAAISMVPNICPSLHYFMSDLPYQQLHRFWPEEYVMNRTEIRDRRLHRWPYRRPPSYETWRRFTSSHARTEYDIHDVPWYGDWYPKPSLPLKKNALLDSLPKRVFIRSLIPFLSIADVKSMVLARSILK